MVHRGDGEIGAPDLQAALAEALESLGRGDFMDQVKVDEKAGWERRGCSWTTWESQSFSMMVRNGGQLYCDIAAVPVRRHG